MDDIQLIEKNAGVEVYDRNNQRIVLFGQTRGDSLKVKDVPVFMRDAVIAIEDRRFFDHIGLDPLGIARAMIRNVQAGGFVQGGSTITQQVAKNVFLTPERTLYRKVQEAILALWPKK